MTLLRKTTHLLSASLLLLVSMPAAQFFHGPPAVHGGSPAGHCHASSAGHEEPPERCGERERQHQQHQHRCAICDLLASGMTSTLVFAPGLVTLVTMPREAPPCRPIAVSSERFITQHGPRAPPPPA